MNSCSDSSNDSVEPNVNHVAGVHTELHMNFSAACKPASQERYVWEMRTRSPNVTPASTVLNSPDLNAELQYAPMHHHQAFEQVSPSNQMPGGYLGTQQQQQQQSAYYYQRPHPHQIRVGRSPGSSQFEPEVTFDSILHSFELYPFLLTSIGHSESRLANRCGQSRWPVFAGR